MNIETLAQRHVDPAELCASLTIRVGSCVVELRANREALIEELHEYFAPWRVAGDEALREGDEHIVVQAFEAEVPSFDDLEFADWPRDQGKVGRKDAIAAIPGGGRVVRKVRTGMHYILGPGMRVTFGPCAANSNQVVNFVNAQVLNHHYERGAALCHAAGIVTEEGKGLAISGFSGGGKSTLALWLIGDGASFVSNDRLLVSEAEGAGSVAEMCGVPKLPRINPGTLLHNPALAGILSSERVEELRGLPNSELWDLEEKYDVDIDQCFGAGRILGRSPLHAFLVLSWKRDVEDETRIEQVDLGERRELIAAIRKSPGPFWVDENGNGPSAPTMRDDESYLAALSSVRVFEATGRVDFERARILMRQRLAELPDSAASSVENV